MDERLFRLRMELFTAAQALSGEDAEEFWKLLDEVQRTRVAFARAPEPKAKPEED